MQFGHWLVARLRRRGQAINTLRRKVIRRILRRDLRSGLFTTPNNLQVREIGTNRHHLANWRSETLSLVLQCQNAQFGAKEVHGFRVQMPIYQMVGGLSLLNGFSHQSFEKRVFVCPFHMDFS